MYTVMSLTGKREEVAEDVQEARRLLQKVHGMSDIPVVSHAAFQADMYCHRMMWELGEEEATTPELDERGGE